MFDKDHFIKKAAEGAKVLDFSNLVASDSSLIDIFNLPKVSKYGGDGSLLSISKDKLAHTRKSPSDSSDTLFEMFDFPTKKKLWSITIGRVLQAPCALLPNNRIAIVESLETYGNPHIISVRDCNTGKIVSQLSPPTSKDSHHSICPKIHALAVLSDGRLVSGHSSGNIMLWDVDKKQLLSNFTEHKNPVKFLIALPKGEFMSCAPYESYSDDPRGCFRLWTGESGGKFMVTGKLFASGFSTGYHLYDLCFTGIGIDNVIVLSNGLLGCIKSDKIELNDYKTGKHHGTIKGPITGFSKAQLIPLPKGLLLAGVDLGHYSTPKIEIWDANKVRYGEVELARKERLFELCGSNDAILLSYKDSIYEYKLQRRLAFKDILPVLEEKKGKKLLESLNVSGIEMTSNE
nr:hypothetical protein [Pseudomonadota bacterium]